VHVPPDGREQFGFKDSISEPAVEGTDILGSNPHEAPLKAGEFRPGLPGRTATCRPVPQPEVLGRNGTYVAFRKLHQRVAAFREYWARMPRTTPSRSGLRPSSSGAGPAARRSPWPGQGRPRTGRRSARNNAFMYGDDPRGLKCPVGAHARRMNARDAVITGQVRACTA
jgi:deferrochelatase/peroxidase EfeB